MGCMMQKVETLSPIPHRFWAREAGGFALQHMQTRRHEPMNLVMCRSILHSLMLLLLHHETCYEGECSQNFSGKITLTAAS
jgi:hypothetical protein